MKNLTIVTDSWQIFEYDEFFSIGMIQLLDSEENELYAVVGFYDGERQDYDILCVEQTQNGMMAQFERLCICLDAGKPLIDYRKPNGPSNNIELLSNSRSKPGSENN